jgi:toxin ParE1/3/4
MSPLRISPRAAADLDEIGDYIARDNPERAHTFVEELCAACERACNNPEAYPLRPDIAADVRMAVHGRYLIFFRVLLSEVRIERVLHGARNLRSAWES